MARGVGVAMLVACALLLSSCPTAAQAATTVTYAPPVDAGVIDPFRAPASLYGPGNRGLEYATDAGAPVRAAADGDVIFAGPVAGSLHVTVLHADGLRTSYSFLATLVVNAGQRVSRGDLIGRSGIQFHFGARDPADNYLDPAQLFASDAHARARLIPGVDEGLAPLVRTERRDFLRLVVERARAGLENGRLLAHYAVELQPEVRAAHVVERLARLRAQQRACTPDGEPVPARTDGRIAVLVGGLGSTSERAAVDDVDTAGLGFGAGDVLRFSYAGGRVPDPTDGLQFAAVRAQGYAATATTTDLAVEADLLAALLRAVAQEQPGVPIDVIGHSQGGVVARLAVEQAATEGTLPPEVATLAVLAAPQQGTDLATAAELLRLRPGPSPVSWLARSAGYDPVAPSVRQLSEVAPFIDQLDDQAVPPRIHRVSIAARADLVVPLPRTMDEDFPTAIVALGGVQAHDELPGAGATTRELALAIAGRPPTCVPPDVLLSAALAGEAISWATDAVGAALLTGG